MRIVWEQGSGFWLEGLFVVYDGAVRRFLAYPEPPPHPLSDQLYLLVNPRERSDDRYLQAILRWSVAKIEEALSNGVEPGSDPGPTSDKAFRKLQIDASDLAELGAIARSKACLYRTAEHGEFFCNVAVPDHDRTAKERVAPTSQPLCMRCELPAQEYVCSNLHHPAIGADIPQGKAVAFRRYLLGAHCELDKLNNNKETGSLCYATGKDCWERIVDLRPRLLKVPESYRPRALTQAFDYLNSVWRLKFGNSNRLLQLRSAASVAGLEGACTSRDEFDSRLSSLADTIKTFDIPDAIIPGSTLKKDQTIKRLEAAVSQFSGGSVPSGEFSAAISTLYAVNELRVSFQHGQTTANQANAFKALGITSPGENWSLDWDTIRAVTTSALGVIAAELNKYT